jgi:hypothetical protein
MTTTGQIMPSRNQEVPSHLKRDGTSILGQFAASEDVQALREDQVGSAGGLKLAGPESRWFGTVPAGTGDKGVQREGTQTTGSLEVNLSGSIGAIASEKTKTEVYED